MGVGDSVTARVPALECQQERAGSQELELLGFSYFLPLSRPTPWRQGERMAQQAWPSSQFPLSHPHPQSPLYKEQANLSDPG